MTIQQFVNRFHVSMTSRFVADNPNMAGDMPAGSTHWRVTLRMRDDDGKRQMTTYFSMGPAHSGEPEVGDVLGCLLSDAAYGDHTFEEWCDELGYDSDSRKAHKLYRTVHTQTRRLRNFLGANFERALYAER